MTGDFHENAVIEAAPGLCTDRRLNRPISARSPVEGKTAFDTASTTLIAL